MPPNVLLLYTIVWAILGVLAKYLISQCSIECLIWGAVELKPLCVNEWAGLQQRALQPHSW